MVFHVSIVINIHTLCIYPMHIMVRDVLCVCVKCIAAMAFLSQNTLKNCLHEFLGFLSGIV